MQLLVRLLLLLSLSALGACATIVEGDDQTVTVTTDPAGATCTLTREGETIGVANPTPASVVLEKDSDNVSVICKKDGYFDAGSALSSSFQAMTFGNIIFGGLIGVVVDAASGAMHKYPASITISLIPKSFPNATALEEFFERRKSRIETDAAAAITEVRKSCDSSENDCDALVSAINSERDAQLKELETQKKAAKIDQG